MEVFQSRARVNADGTLTRCGLPFSAGEEVEVVVTSASPADGSDLYPLRGLPLRYPEPSAPVAEGNWDALRGDSQDPSRDYP